MIFVDSSFLIAYLIGRDQNHQAALQLAELIADRPIVTTNHVRGETWTWLRSRTWHDRAVSFLESVGRAEQHIQVARIPEDIENEALDWLRQHDEREYSFVDATSFAYMRAKRIDEVLAFDGDFAAAGFTELRP